MLFRSHDIDYDQPPSGALRTRSVPTLLSLIVQGIVLNVMDLPRPHLGLIERHAVMDGTQDFRT